MADKVNYAQMTDRDIQQDVLRLTWGKHPVRLLGKLMIDIPLSEYDPCNSWADAGPIIFNYGISIMKDRGLHLWCATSIAYWADGSEWQMGQEVMNANPLRAAMIVFLMMQEGE